MKAILVIASITAIFGLILFIFHKIGERRNAGKPQPEEEEPVAPAGEQCCGMHITCEKDSLIQGVSTEIVYYDDEELDAYKEVDPESYTDSQIEEFRDVLLTLLPSDIAGWARSLQLRGIALPPAVKEELIMIVSEERYRLNQGHN